VTIAVLDTSAHVYNIMNSTPTLLYQKTASPGQALAYSLLHSGGIWQAYIHWWTT